MPFKLKELFKKKKISRQRLAIDLNTYQNITGRYENMERQADYETLVRFADYFDISLDYLLERIDKEK